MSQSISVSTADDRIVCVWKQAVAEYLEIAQLSKSDAEWLAQTKASTEVVSIAVQAQKMDKTDRSVKFSQKMFIAAVISAGTHTELVDKVEVLKGGHVPAVVSNQVATFLRYATAIDAFLDAMGNITFASAFVFGAIRYMLIIAVKNMKLLIAIREKFNDIEIRLRRLDAYLTLKQPSEAVRLMCVRVLVNILRFCGLATKYFRSSIFPHRLLMS